MNLGTDNKVDGVTNRSCLDSGVVKNVVDKCRLRSFDFFFFSSRRRHTRFDCDWSSDVCSSDLLRRRISTPLSPTPIGRGVGKTTNVAALSIKPGDVTIAVGGAVQLTVTAKRRSGSTQAGRGATWASTHPEIVTVSSSGPATAVAAGPAPLPATLG